MFFRLVLVVWEFVLDLVSVMRLSDDEKDLEIMLLRQQLRIVERKQVRGPQIPRWQKVPLAVLAMRLKNNASHAREALAESIRLFRPDTVIGWHRDMVQRKWTFKQRRKRGRPPVDSNLEGWILQVAHDNPTLGYDKMEGELRTLGLEVGATTIRTVLQRHGVPRTLERSRRGSSWPAVFSRSKPSRCKRCTCCFLSSTDHVRCILQAARRIQTAPGSPNKRGT
jgi:putative transposase